MKVALSSGGQNQKLESVMSKPLKDQAFATPDKVAELVQKVGKPLELCSHYSFIGQRIILFRKDSSYILEAFSMRVLLLVENQIIFG